MNYSWDDIGDYIPQRFNDSDTWNSYESLLTLNEQCRQIPDVFESYRRIKVRVGGHSAAGRRVHGDANSAVNLDF